MLQDKLQMINDELANIIEDLIELRLSDEEFNSLFNEKIEEEARRLIMHSRYLNTMINVKL